MSTIKLKGSSSGEAEVTVAAAAGTPTFTLPTTVGSANQVVKNSGTAGTLEFSSIVDSSGKVGIGTSNVGKNSHSLLNVHRATSDSNYMYFTNTTTGETGGDGFTIGIDGDEKALLWNRENTDMRFATNGTERLTIKNNGHVSIVSGNLEFASGAGVDFSNVSDGSRSIGTDGNKFDDYEEGTWTPTMPSVSSETITVQKGRYTKIGNIVHIWFDMVWTAASNLSGANIGGLPYNTTATQSQGGYGAPQFRSLTGVESDIRIYGNSSYFDTNVIRILKFNSSGTEGAAAWLGSGRITGSGFYYTNNVY